MKRRVDCGEIMFGVELTLEARRHHPIIHMNTALSTTAKRLHPRWVNCLITDLGLRKCEVAKTPQQVELRRSVDKRTTSRLLYSQNKESGAGKCIDKILT
eukprot:scaffold17433_cov52-Cyclotella_meneghiniana.AAC.3